MRSRFWGVAIALALVLSSMTAMAQDNVMTNGDFAVSWTRPEGWEVVENNDRAIFNIKHEESQSQIEVIATELMSPDVATVFYSTFHDTLAASNFTLNGTPAEQTIGAHSGELTKYDFNYAGVDLTIVIFQFTHESTAYLIVGYIKRDEFETYYPSFEEAIGTLTFG